MSAEVLREAARLMRERAENSATAMVGPLTWTTHFDATDSQTCLHYQHMTPAVALAVADWLAHEGEACGLERSPFVDDGHALAHAVARAYLGQPPP